MLEKQTARNAKYLVTWSFIRPHYSPKVPVSGKSLKHSKLKARAKVRAIDFWVEVTENLQFLYNRSANKQPTFKLDQRPKVQPKLQSVLDIMDPGDLQNSSFCNKSENQSETSIDPIDQYSLICYNSIDQYLEYANVDRSIDNSRRNSIDTNNEPTKQINSIAKVATWIDSIYDLFQEPKSNPVVSQDKLLNDNISYEESEVRIIILASILALSLSLIASTMLGLLAANSSPTRQIIWNYEPPVSKPKSRRPHVALLFFDGRMNIYELNSSNNHLGSFHLKTSSSILTST